MKNEYLRRPDEDDKDYELRLIIGKVEKTIDLDWVEIRDLLNLDCHPDHLRKMGYGIYKYYDHIRSKFEKTPTSKLDVVREKLGELDILKRKVQTEKTELNKIKRDLIKSVAVADEMKQFLEDNCTIIIPEYCHTPLQGIEDKYEMIVHISDWHIGYVIDDCKGNYYNWAIANERVDKLIQECYKYIELFNISKIYVVNTGDVLEHVYMRANQSQFCEFPQAEQINRSIQLIYRLLTALCKYCNVEYDSVYGNHDRFSGDKTANLDGDNAEVIIREQLKTYKELTNNVRLTVVDRKFNEKEIKKIINGLNCKFTHGEHSRNADGKQVLKNEMSVDNEFYDLLFKGHLHNFKVESENNGRYVVTTGCLSGFNDYSVQFGCSSVASQTIVIVDEGKVELIKDIQLQ